MFDDAFHNDRRLEFAQARQRGEMFVVKALIGGHVGGDDAEEVVGFAEESLGFHDLWKCGERFLERVEPALDRILGVLDV